MHKGVMPLNNPLPCLSVLSHSFKPQQRMQVDSSIPSDSMDAIIFAKLGSSLDHTMGVQVCYSHAIGAASQTSPLQEALHKPHFMQGFIQAEGKGPLEFPDSVARLLGERTCQRNAMQICASELPSPSA